MKKIRPLILLVPFIISSCSKQTFLGEYSFILGNMSETHVGINLKLKDDFYNSDLIENELNAKKYDLQLLTDNLPTSEIKDIEDQNFTIKGYYYITENADKTNRLNLGTTVLEDFFGMSFGIEGGIDVPPELTELFISASITYEKVKVTVPVSLDDVKYQLYWYGYKVNVNDLSFTEVTKHDVDTHPTAEDVKKIQEAEAEDDTFKNYRDYHTVTITLSKK